jgi:toxin-antitoxin system PIN domain toxin
MMSCFPDINVWLAIVIERHVFNARASGWWNQDQSATIGFCRFTQLGLLRHLSNAATMKGSPLTNRQAWKVFETLQTDARVRFFPEWPALDGLLKSYSDVNQAATNLWGDAYLAAYAAVNDITLVTFDKGFARYPIKTLILEP